MEYDVTENRNDYIGGSDIPIIMGISPFKKRFDLLLEKAGLKENDFTGNKYTVYGQHLEPKIRDYINETKGVEFEPNRTIKGGIRCHTDGFYKNTVLEIKTTSHISKDINDYKGYLVQLLLYMDINGAKSGILAVYERPDDMGEDFNKDRLQIFDIQIENYVSMIVDIYAAIGQFAADLEKLKANPLLTEEDFQPKELTVLSREVVILEKRLDEYKEIEKQYKELKQKLFDSMVKHDIKSWQTFNGTKITRVDGTPATVETVKVLDEKTLKAEQPEIYEKYIIETEKKKAGRSGYVKVTVPKNGL